MDTTYVNVNGYTQSTSSTWTHAPATIANSPRGASWKMITVMIMASDGPAVDRIGVVRLFGLTLKLQSGLSAGNYKPFFVTCNEYRNSGGTRFNKYEKSLGFGHLDAPALDAEIRVVEKQTVGAFAHSAESTGGGPVWDARQLTGQIPHRDYGCKAACDFPTDTYNHVFSSVNPTAFSTSDPRREGSST